jgi:hypothetical protein
MQERREGAIAALFGRPRPPQRAVCAVVPGACLDAGEGAQKGLIIMSSGFCKSPEASVKFTGQNGMESDTTPKVAGKCPKKGHGKKGKGKSRNPQAHTRPLAWLSGLGF